MNVIIKKVDEKPEVIRVEGDKIGLEFLNKSVGGYIEFASYGAFRMMGIDICLNEEGKLIGMEANIFITDRGKIVDVLVGDLVFLAHDGEGNSVGLSDEHIEFILSYLSRNNALIGSDIEDAKYYSFIECR